MMGRPIQIVDEDGPVDPVALPKHTGMLDLLLHACVMGEVLRRVRLSGVDEQELVAERLVFARQLLDSGTRYPAERSGEAAELDNDIRLGRVVT